MKKIQIHYTITEKTLALIPAFQIEYDTIVFEMDQILHIKKSPLELIKTACLDHWCNYEGRRQAVIHHTGFKQKTPIPINIYKEICFFPTHSPKNINNKWISFKHIIKYIIVSHNPTKTKVIFSNGMQLELNISKHIIKNQIQRAFECMYRMKNNLGEKEDRGIVF